MGVGVLMDSAQPLLYAQCSRAGRGSAALPLRLFMVPFVSNNGSQIATHCLRQMALCDSQRVDRAEVLHVVGC